MLITRCPSCSTTFRVRPEQLGQRAGRVRCGNCQKPFSALASLEEMQDDEADITKINQNAAPAAVTPRKTPEQAPVSEPAPEPDDEQDYEPEPAPMIGGANQLPAIKPVMRDASLGIQLPSPPRSSQSSASAFHGAMTDSNLDDRALSDALDATLLGRNSTPTQRGGFSVDTVDTQGIEVSEHTSMDIDLSDDIALDASPEFEIPEFEVPNFDELPSGPVEPALSEPEAEPEPIYVDTLSNTDVDLRADEVIHIHAVPEDETPTEVQNQPVEPIQISNRFDPDTLPQPDHYTGSFDEPTKPRRGLWIAASVVLVLVAGVLIAALFRTDLARMQPALRAPMEQLCEQIGCDVPYPRSADDIGVEGTDLVPDGGNGNFRLIVTLRNRAHYAQEWPYVELTLTDRFDRALARKVFTPAEWLPADMKNRPAFNAGEELTAQVPLNAKDLPAAGFRVYVFHP